MASVTQLYRHDSILSDQIEREREIILAGIQEVREGKTQDYNVVFDRLEKRILDAMVSD